MNKFFVVLVSLLLTTVVSAHSFSVSAVLAPQETPAVAAEFAVDVFAGLDATVGLVSQLDELAFDVSLGTQYGFGVDGGDVYVVSRVLVPLYADDSFQLGQVYGNVGVSLVPTAQSTGTVVFEAGLQPVFDEFVFSEFPDVYARVGVLF